MKTPARRLATGRLCALLVSCTLGLSQVTLELTPNPAAASVLATDNDNTS